MPGYHGKVALHPEMHTMHHPRSKEGLYPRHYPMGKMAPMVLHPMGQTLYDPHRSRHGHHNKGDYSYMIKSKMGGDGGYPTFDSLKLLGSENDANYLDAFMNGNSDSLKHRRYPNDDNDTRPRARSCSQTKNNNLNNILNNSNNKRNSFNVDSLKKTILGSLRSAASDENIYESVEVIQYRKTIEAIKRQRKEKKVPKTGHPLFDHLRVEKVLSGGGRHHHRQNSHTSDGGSNSQSSSGSGDEFDTARKPRFSRRELVHTSKDGKKHSHTSTHKHMTHKSHKRDSLSHSQSHHNLVEAGSESDDDWAIPRPKICGGGGQGRSRRTGATGLAGHHGSHDESDSSSKSTGLR